MLVLSLFTFAMKEAIGKSVKQKIICIFHVDLVILLMAESRTARLLSYFEREY